MGDDETAEESVVYEVSEAVVKRILEVFAKWDIMEDGLILIETLPNIECGPRKFDVTSMLREMDTNDDGRVEKSEWETYWKQIVAKTGEATFTTAMDEIDNADLLDKVRVLLLNKQFNADISMPDEEEGEEEEGEAAELSEERAKKVDELFSAWDPNGTGKIMLTRMRAAGIKVGPTVFDPTEAFAQMDTNADGSVSKEELRAYFAMLDLDEATFDLILDEMTKVAETKVAIDRNLELAISMQMGGVSSGGDDGEGGEAAAPDERQLSDAQKEHCKSIFLSLGSADSLDEAIDIVHCQKSATASAGPHKMNVLEMLPQMDENKDGKLEYSELVNFLTLMMRSLPSTDFEVLLEELVANSQAAKTMKMLQNS